MQSLSYRNKVGDYFFQEILLCTILIDYNSKISSIKIVTWYQNVYATSFWIALKSHHRFKCISLEIKKYSSLKRQSLNVALTPARFTPVRCAEVRQQEASSPATDPLWFLEITQNLRRGNILNTEEIQGAESLLSCHKSLRLPKTLENPKVHNLVHMSLPLVPFSELDVSSQYRQIIFL